ncbi:lipopolysaccharide assembly protein LapA domain-containing protein [Paenibacillus sp. MZ04-78.2]|uniref:LapA family protein n=1 Tax=Paenibacillus sp. MZ04-78.2 TaxID=2962034 RepID=UPI0020B7FFDD|nr:lipopolysaccharide assembly protein LapA domain-containing protein [Paenibacillus sp. MZ04-78.2]MCP3772089.1 lipopolysaccharide assembly protein LapA domain-containing protein [Paenibacillus sp. MZ04-78.2]
MKAQWMLISTLLFALITAVFAVINVKPVRVNFLFTQADIPLILVILGSTLLGGLIAFLIGLFREIKLQRKIKQLEKQLSETSPEQALAVSEEAGSPSFLSADTDLGHPEEKNHSSK